jgi:hypothetical protein
MTYKGHRVEAISYQLVHSGRWVPKVLVLSSSGDNPTTPPLTAFGHPQDTQAAADGHAMTLAKMWIDGKA